MVLVVSGTVPLPFKNVHGARQFIYRLIDILV